MTHVHALSLVDMPFCTHSYSIEEPPQLAADHNFDDSNQIWPPALVLGLDVEKHLKADETLSKLNKM